MIRRIGLKGYKSIEEGKLTLRPVRTLIGPNASGKSNVIDALRLLHEAVRSGRETAVARRGGWKLIPLGVPAGSWGAPPACKWSSSGCGRTASETSSAEDWS